jgi:hypothetical protein
VKQPVRIYFHREGQQHLSALDILVDDPIDVLNIANRHFGDPTRHIGGPELPRLIDQRPERMQ